MTDRHAGYIVTLEQNVREDDAEDLIKAIGMLRGVISVTPVIGNTDISLATSRAKYDLQKRLWQAFHEDS